MNFLNGDFRVSGFGGFIYRLRTTETLGTNTIGGLNFPGWYSFNNQAGIPDAGNAYLLRSYGRGSDVSVWCSSICYASPGKTSFTWICRRARIGTQPFLPITTRYFFPGASLTWNYTERYNIPWMNRGQVRLAWADVGNGTSRYFANNQYDTRIYFRNRNAQAVVGPPGSIMPDPLRPERKENLKLALITAFLRTTGLPLICLTTPIMFMTRSSVSRYRSLQALMVC